MRRNCHLRHFQSYLEISTARVVNKIEIKCGHTCAILRLEMWLITATNTVPSPRSKSSCRTSTTRVWFHIGCRLLRTAVVEDFAGRRAAASLRK